MGTIKMSGIIISENNLGDYDKMLTMLTPGLGKISCVAKGARRQKSALLAGTQFLCFGEYLMYKGANTYNINSCETIEVFYNLRTDLDKLNYAVEITKIIRDVTDENENCYKILQLFLNTLYTLSETDKNPELIMSIFKLKLLCFLGFTPRINECTNCKQKEELSKLSEKGLLANIRKNTVDFVPNYSETEDEPVTLPAIFPNLLCNPNTGIGVAIACNWLPHNLKEVAQAIYDYVDGKEPMIPGPDFPTGGLIINGNDLPNIIRTGKGSVKIRGKYNIENNNIVFYEIPYGTGTEDLMNEIGTACDEERIHGITNIRNESNRKKGFRLVIECDKNANMATIIASLFKETSLQTSISYNQVALVDKTPTELGLKDCIKIYIDHNVSCITREANFDKAKAEARLHIVDGLIKALENIDDIINLIKSADSSADAKVKLISKYGFSEEQAKAILDMKLSRLAKLEKIELEEEKEKLHA